MSENYSPFLSLLLFLFLIAGTIGWGVFLLHISGFYRKLPDNLYLLLYALLIGLLFTGDLLLFSGMSGLLQKWIIGIIFISGIITGVFSLFGIRGIFKHDAQNLLPDKRTVFFILLCIPFFVVIFLDALIPDKSGDAYLYHMTVPNFYAQEGRIIPVRYSFCYNYPLQLEMFTMASIRLGSSQAGILFNASALFFTCIGLYLAGRKISGRFTGMAAVFLLLSMPLTVKWAPTSLVDLTAALFITGSFLAFLHWKREDAIGWLFLCGISAGGAMTAKIITAPYIFILLPSAIFYVLIRREKKISFKDGLLQVSIYGCAAFVPLLPWMIKNGLFTGNPFYPFLLEFIPTRPDLVHSAKVLHNLHGIPPFDISTKTLKRITGVFSLFTWGGNWMPILGMAAAPAGFVLSLKRKKNMEFWGIVLSLSLFILYYGKNAQVRWFQGFYPLFALGIAILLFRLFMYRPAIGRFAVVAILFVSLAVAAKHYFLLMGENGRYPWIPFSQTAMKDYIENMEKKDQADVINRNIPPEGKVMLYHTEILSPGRFLKRRFIQSGLSWFRRWDETNEPTEEMFQALRKKGVTHIAHLGFERFDSFERLKKEHLEKTSEAPGVTIYRLK